MHPRTRARLAATILAGAAITLAALSYWPQAIPLAIAAAAVVTLVPDRSLSEDVAKALAEGPTQTLTDLADATRLEGNGILRRHDDRVLLFVPAKPIDATQCPSFDGHTYLHQRPPAIGMWCTPPGQGLYKLWASQGNPPRQRGLEEATAILKQALPAMGLGDDVTVEAGKNLRVRYAPAIASTSDAGRAWHRQGADPVTSFVGMVIAACVDRPIRLVQHERIDGGILTEWA